MAIQLGAVARPRLLCNFLAHPVHIAEPFATFAGGAGGSVPEAEGLHRTRVLAAWIRNVLPLEVLLHDGDVVDAADFLDDLGEMMRSVNYKVAHLLREKDMLTPNSKLRLAVNSYCDLGR